MLTEAGIFYCNGAATSSEAVADMAIYHILLVFRNLQWTNMAARTGDSEQWLDAHRNATMTAHNPRGHTLGVIGLGNIGYTIAQKAYAAFGMKIMYNDLFQKGSEKGKAIGATYYKDLGEMLAISYYVCIATPGAGGKKLIDASVLKKFMKGSRLVNIARGQLLDEEAVADALESGQLHAAGLDVHENEPYVSPQLTKMRSVTLTCHSAGGAIETNVGFEALSMENVEKVLTGQKPLTPVNEHLMKNRPT